MRGPILSLPQAIMTNRVFLARELQLQIRFVAITCPVCHLEYCVLIEIVATEFYSKGGIYYLVF